MSKKLFTGTTSGLELWVDVRVLEKLRQEAADRHAKLQVRDGDKRVGVRPVEIAIQEIWNHVRACGECWNWHGPRDLDQYGITYINGRNYRANRFIYWLVNGTLQNENCNQVLHKCDNPPCVRPEHLFLGSAADNVADALTKGRNAGPAGELNGQAVLNVEQVTEIRKRFNFRGETDSGKALAIEFGVSRSCISNIVRERKWKQRDEPPY